MATVCRNCGWMAPSRRFFAGWCRDCWTAFGKGVAAAAGAMLVSWLAGVL